MNENNLNNVLPAVVEATTLNIVSLNESRATLATDDGKELTIYLVQGTIQDYLVKGDMYFAVEGKEDLIATLGMCYPKFDKQSPEFEELIATSLNNYESYLGTEDIHRGTYCVAKITKAEGCSAKREYLACYRGCEGAFRWIYNYMRNNSNEGFKYMSRVGRDCIYKEFEDGSKIMFTPYHISRQDPTINTARHYLESSN